MNRCTEQDTIDALAREIEHYKSIGDLVAVASREESIRARRNTQLQSWHRGDCEFHRNAAEDAGNGNLQSS